MDLRFNHRTYEETHHGLFWVLLIILVLILLVIAVGRIIRLWLKIGWSIFSCKDFVDETGAYQRVSIMRVVLFLLCVRQSLACMVQHEDGLVYLKEGHDLCLSDSTVMVTPLHQELGISYLYETGFYDLVHGSMLGCLNGDHCGSENDCFNANQNTLLREEDRTVKKRCHMFYGRSTRIMCWSERRCWIWTKQVRQRSPLIAYRVGPGLKIHFQTPLCHISYENLDLQAFHGTIFLTGESGSWICPDGSGAGSPQWGRLGDVQTYNGTHMVDWDGWKCDMQDDESSGFCHTPNLYTDHLLEKECVKLPGLFGEFRVELKTHGLRVSPLNGWPAIVKCREDLLPDPPATCYGAEGYIGGHEGLESDAIYLRARGGRDHTIMVNVSCLPYKIELTCDDEWLSLPILTPGDCYLNGYRLTDQRSVIAIDDFDVKIPVADHKLTGPISLMTAGIVLALLLLISLLIKFVKLVFC